MRLRLIKIRDSLADSFWFLPAVIALLAAAAAVGLVTLDRTVGGSWAHHAGWLWAGGADGARSVLSVVAGSVMTVVSIVFSLTITTLAQTSSHYGPRVLRNFTSDRGVQFTLGTFIATFVYCLLVLRTVRSVEEDGFVPYLAVNLGVLLALASLGVLIYFIHHVSQSIQAENLIAGIGRDFQLSLPVLFPEQIGKPALNVTGPDPAEWEKAGTVASAEGGYLQRIDDDRLMELATEHDLLIHLDKRPGEFVSLNSFLLRVLPAKRITAEVSVALQGCFSLGQYRTPSQDTLYSLQQLVEIAAHALSPGINEPFTAITCIDWLGNSLRGAASRPQPIAERRGAKGELRVIARPVTFPEMVQTSFDQIRVYGANSPSVLTSMLTTIAGLAPALHRSADREALIRQIRYIGVDARQIKNDFDRVQVENHAREAMSACSGDR